MDERAYWVALTMVSQIGPARMMRLLERFGEAQAAWRASPLDLAGAGLDRRAIESLATLRQTLDPAVEWRRIEAAGAQVLTLDDPSYPSRLRQIADAPPVLYVKGDLIDADDWSIAVVGTRRSTPYGRQATERIVGDIAAAGVIVVSGLARGIDTWAHKAALARGGRTIAVLGSGVDRIYPDENRALASQIAEHGAIISEFPIGTQPDAMNFPRRNRIVSGLTRGTLIVEADYKSGAMHTANYAAEQGRDVFAVPGSIFESGLGRPEPVDQGRRPRRDRGCRHPGRASPDGGRRAAHRSRDAAGRSGRGDAPRPADARADPRRRSHAHRSTSVLSGERDADAARAEGARSPDRADAVRLRLSVTL